MQDQVKYVVSLSGGMDSATVLGETLTRNGNKPHEIRAVMFDYGSKHNRYERIAARAIALHYGVQLYEMDLGNIFERFDSALLKNGAPIPEGHYEAESMRKTVVPCRNMIFASILTGFAESVGADRVILGVHAGDHFIYPDCRPKFIQHIACAADDATDGKVTVFAPYLKIEKASILKIGTHFKVPYELTRTCYKNQGIACGKCGSCQERLEAFARNGLVDPLQYESREIMPKEPTKETQQESRQWEATTS